MAKMLFLLPFCLLFFEYRQRIFYQKFLPPYMNTVNCTCTHVCFCYHHNLVLLIQGIVLINTEEVEIRSCLDLFPIFHLWSYYQTACTTIMRLIGRVRETEFGQIVFMRSLTIFISLQRWTNFCSQLASYISTLAISVFLYIYFL